MGFRATGGSPPRSSLWCLRVFVESRDHGHRASHLALGIGRTPLSSVWRKTFLLKSLPVSHPEEPAKIGILPADEFEQNAYEYLRDHQKTLTGIIAWDEGNIAAVIDGKPGIITVDYLNGIFIPPRR